MSVAERTTPAAPAAPVGPARLAEPVPIADVRWRQRVVVRGTVRSMRVRPWAEGVSTLEATLVDETGGVTLVFLGRKRIAGLGLGSSLEAEGMVGENRGRLVIINPVYRLHPG